MVISKLFVITSIVFLLVSSCSNVASNTNSIASTATIQIPTDAPTSTPTLVATEIVQTLTPSPPESILKFQPFEIKAELPSDVRPAGALLVSGDTVPLMHFDSELKVETLPDVEFDSCLSTSPDGKWLAYCPSSDTSPTGQWLIVQASNGQQQNKLPLHKQAISFGNYIWLDNQRLIFPLVQEEHRPQATYPMLVINPFTKEQIKLNANYPNLWLSPLGPQSRMDLSYSDVVYDPSLDLVIYPSAIEHSYLVLWDRRSHSTLAKVAESIGFYPLWSPDAKQFAVPLLVPKGNGYRVEEWFRVTREGQLEQLTHFGDYFQSAEMGSVYQWSPDGQKLAFWLDVGPSSCSGQNLAILDISKKQVLDTCISSKYDLPIVWSLDSQYISVATNYDGVKRIILVDSEQPRAFDITALTGRAVPIGWMVSP